MQQILTLLQVLDRSYSSDSLEEYEQIIQKATQQVEILFPGFTIAYAEIATVGAERALSGAMRHVLVPEKNS